MIDRVRTAHDGAQYLGIRGDVGAWVSFGAYDNGGEGFCMEHLPRTLEGLNSEVLVARVAEPIRVDKRVVGRIGGVDGDVAAAQRRYEPDGEGAVVFAVDRRVSEKVRQSSGIAVREGEFKLGPVGRELGEARTSRIFEIGPEFGGQLFPSEKV